MEMRKTFSPSFFSLWEEGFKKYIEGKWLAARDIFK